MDERIRWYGWADTPLDRARAVLTAALEPVLGRPVDAPDPAPRSWAYMDGTVLAVRPNEKAGSKSLLYWSEHPAHRTLVSVLTSPDFDAVERVLIGLPGIVAIPFPPRPASRNDVYGWGPRSVDQAADELSHLLGLVFTEHEGMHLGDHRMAHGTRFTIDVVDNWECDFPHPRDEVGPWAEPDDPNHRAILYVSCRDLPGIAELADILARLPGLRLLRHHKFPGDPPSSEDVRPAYPPASAPRPG